jgi:hypothetical protein
VVVIQEAMGEDIPAVGPTNLEDDDIARAVTLSLKVGLVSSGFRKRFLPVMVWPTVV